jgi:DNA-binding IclR family transcriptional regulator
MKSLLKAMDIVDALAENGSAGIRKLSTITGLPPSTIHRIASTLLERRYLNQDPVTKRYALSFRFLELGTKVQQQFNLSSIAKPHLERLMAETKESVNLAVRDGDSVVYLDHIRSHFAMLQLFTRPGARVPLYATGVGKMFLSQLSDSELDEYLKRTRRMPFTSRTLVKRDEILRELASIRVRGYAVDNEEMEEGVRCVAALVFDHQRQPIAAVSISGAAMRILPERFDFFGKDVKRCVLAISQDLGFPVEASSNQP